MTGRARAPRVPLDELRRTCTRCGHQGAVHTKGADRSGWAVYVPVWRNATGGCSTQECTCPGRTTDPGVERVPVASMPELPAAVTALPVRVRPSGPCGHGAGPCGHLPTRLYPFGPRCAEHAPGAARVALREAA